MATQTKSTGVKETQRSTTDLEALRIEARRPIKCGGTYTQCQKGYEAAKLSEQAK